MYQFRVPLQKDDQFPIDFFNFFAAAINTIASDHEKWPNKVTFLGDISKELINVINEKGWDFKRFNIKHEQSILNKILIEYNKPLNQIENSGYIKGDTLHDKTVNGIPGDETLSKLTTHALNTNFQIERSIRPKLEVKLIR